MTTAPYTKWVACWGNATSIIDQTECTYAKDLTLSYPMRIVFNGSKLRFRFSNISGTEPITINKAVVARTTGDKKIDTTSIKVITKDNKQEFTIEPGKEMTSDEIDYDVTAGDNLTIRFWVKDYTQMNAGVLITGPLSKGHYSVGDQTEAEELPLDLTRNTHWFYFLNTIDILTEEKNRALICFGDSITAQDWPDYLAQRCWDNGWRDVAIIRRAISGTRILREYSCTTYLAYGIKGETRFPLEINVAGADTVLIQHGINDIIHPVGYEVNPWRPWSDLPTVDDMAEGFTKYYIEVARKAGLKVYGGTLLPIEGWRTYEPFRDDLRNGFNNWLRETPLLDGIADFDLAVRNPEHPAQFAQGFDSGDHLHPSASCYKAMGDCVPEELLK